MITIKSFIDIRQDTDYLNDTLYATLHAKFTASNGKYVSVTLYKNVKINIMEKIMGKKLKDKLDVEMVRFKKEVENKRIYLEQEINNIEEIRNKHVRWI